MFFGREFADEFVSERDSLYNRLGAEKWAEQLESEEGIELKDKVASNISAYSDFLKVKKSIIKALIDKNTDIDAIVETLQRGTSGNTYFEKSYYHKGSGKWNNRWKFHFDINNYSPDMEDPEDTPENDLRYDECQYCDPWDSYVVPWTDRGKSYILFKERYYYKKSHSDIFAEFVEAKKTGKRYDEINDKYRKLLRVEMMLVDIGKENFCLCSLSVLPDAAAKRIIEYKV